MQGITPDNRTGKWHLDHPLSILHGYDVWHLPLVLFWLERLLCNYIECCTSKDRLPNQLRDHLYLQQLLSRDLVYIYGDQPACRLLPHQSKTERCHDQHRLWFQFGSLRRPKVVSLEKIKLLTYPCLNSATID